jgi:type IV pilus biogenesis protein CpaD/CtpE
MRPATLLAILALVALPLSGCGGSDHETTGTAPAHDPAGVARVVRAEWEQSPDCKRPTGASRWGCSVGDYRCQSVVSDRGWSTSCSKPGRSISFTVRP